jgi:PIN domain nuclease of toxin-antitoxin system
MGGSPLILVDTHVLIWLDQDDPALGRNSRTLVDEALREGALAASAVSFWEVAMLVEKRRIAMDMPLAEWRMDLLGAGLVEVAVDGSIGIKAAELEGAHADPADRMIIASALATGADLLTADKLMLGWPGPINRYDARQ